MNRLILITGIFSIFFSGLSVLSCQVTQFHCKGFDKEYIYSPEQDAEEACKWVNGTEHYNICLNEYNKMLRAYEDGECEPILTEKHISGETGCKVYYYGDRKLQRIICKGPEAEEYKAKVEEMYN